MNPERKRKSRSFGIPGLALLVAFATGNFVIYNHYMNLPISFYMDRGIDPHAPITEAMDKPTLIMYDLSIVGVLISLVLVTVSLCYYAMAKGYTKIFGFLPLLSIIVGVVVGILFGSDAHGPALGLLVSLGFAIILAALPDRTKKSEP
jgi:hypothetical protein